MDDIGRKFQEMARPKKWAVVGTWPDGSLRVFDVVDDIQTASYRYVSTMGGLNKCIRGATDEDERILSAEREKWITFWEGKCSECYGTGISERALEDGDGEQPCEFCDGTGKDSAGV